MKPLLQAMKERRLYLDGGMGSMLQAAGLPEGLLPDVWGMQNPAAVQGVHRAYLEAGARLITTNTFGTSAPKLAPYGVTVDEVMAAAVANVRQAMQQAGVEDAYVCADLGPSGKLLRPYGDLDFEDAVTLFAETVRAAAKAGADCILIETMSDLYEMKAAVLAAKENCDLPILASLIFDATGKLLTGGSPRAAVGLLEGLGVDVLGINCGLGPKEMAPTFEALWEDSSTPLLLQPNAGLPHSVDGKAVYDVSPEEYAAEMLPLAPHGDHSGRLLRHDPGAHQGPHRRDKRVAPARSERRRTHCSSRPIARPWPWTARTPSSSASASTPPARRSSRPPCGRGTPAMSSTKPLSRRRPGRTSWT